MSMIDKVLGFQKIALLISSDTYYSFQKQISVSFWPHLVCQLLLPLNLMESLDKSPVMLSRACDKSYAGIKVSDQTLITHFRYLHYAALNYITQ